MTICGTDEAGRGPVIGPLVMAGVTVETEDKLIKLGVKDSKLLTPQQREDLYDKVLKAVKRYKIIIISPEEIDAREKHNLNLNQLEAVKTAEILNHLKPDKAIIDCPSTNPRAYKSYLKALLKNDMALVVEHKADVNHPVVAAASIIAKVTRDREIEKLKKKIGKDFGSGYPADPRTKEFLEKNWDRYPGLFRQTWASWTDVKNKKGQKTLEGF